MAKFAGDPTAVPSAVKTTSTVPDSHTFEGAPSYSLDPKGELFTTAVTSLIEDTFYEKGGARLDRMVGLARSVTKLDSEWMQMFIPWLRKEGFMRSAPVVLAAEYVAGGGHNGRQVVNSALQRADEPAELLGYWLSRYGRALPQPIKRGVADAVVRLYNERAVLKYDGKGQTFRFGDVLELVHPKPKAQWQSDLFKFCLDRRRHPAVIDGTVLPMLTQALYLEGLPEDQRRAVSPDALRSAGFTWERLSGWLPGGMDAAAWESIIPSMGYMALLRNLRNFDQAGIERDVATGVANTLAEPLEVARSKQFPFRFYSAWKQGVELRWASVLEEALELSVLNVPALKGRTLVVVDTTSSMNQNMSAHGTITPLEAATLFGAAVYARNRGQVDLVWATTQSGPLPYVGSVLRTIDWVKHNLRPEATYLGAAVNQHYRGHDRIMLFTDGQFHDRLPETSVPTYLFLLTGYKTVPLKAGHGSGHILGGLSDATFKLIPMLEAQHAGVWPWEQFALASQDVEET